MEKNRDSRDGRTGRALSHPGRLTPSRPNSRFQSLASFMVTRPMQLSRARENSRLPWHALATH
jgi:hypothetical protein